MKFSPLRIGVTVAAVLLVMISIGSGWPRFAHVVHVAPPQEPEWSPWIGLPAAGMDASKRELRSTLWLAAEVGAIHRKSLFHLCGTPEIESREIYTAFLGDPVIHGDAETWRVEMIVHGERVQIRVSELDAMLPPPSLPRSPREEEPGFDADTGDKLVRRRSYATMEKTQLAVIADRWKASNLWDSEQGVGLCADGMPALLEACVDGKYAVRNWNCSSHSLDAASELWRTVREVLPPPR